MKFPIDWPARFRENCNCNRKYVFISCTSAHRLACFYKFRELGSHGSTEWLFCARPWNTLSVLNIWVAGRFLHWRQAFLIWGCTLFCMSWKLTNVIKLDCILSDLNAIFSRSHFSTFLYHIASFQLMLIKTSCTTFLHLNVKYWSVVISLYCYIWLQAYSFFVAFVNLEGCLIVSRTMFSFFTFLITRKPVRTWG